MNPVLTADDIHLWLVDLDQPLTPLPELAATLTADEQERAGRFRFPEHQARFIAGRGLLRELLSGYLNRPAAALRFRRGLHGKPELAGEEAAAGLHFNLSHSGHRALYAVARREVGVDLEKLDRSADYAGIMARICGPQEQAAFQTLHPEQRQDAFFACWTRKEAIAKAIGSGFASGLPTLEVCLPDSDRAKAHDPAGREWGVMNVSLEPGWAGAVAATGVDWRWIRI